MTRRPHAEDKSRSDTSWNQPLAQMAISEPQPFGRYSLVGKLGHGRLSELLLGVAPPGESPSLVTVKRLHKYVTADQELVEFFRSEMAAASRVRHPSLTAVLNYGVQDDFAYVVKEYLDGVGLDRLMRRCQSRGVKLGTALSANVALQILEGLVCAHEARDAQGALLGLVHRDLRPRHVFITAAGEAKILDFGLARIAARRISSSLSQLRGPLQYTAPEHVRGDEIDQRADVWAVGVMLWEALAGRGLFPDAGSAVEQLQQVLDAPIPGLNDAATTVPTELARVAAMALRREIGARYQTARAMADELRAAVADLPDATDHAALAAFVSRLFGDDLEAQRGLVSRVVGAVRPDAVPSAPRAPSGPKPAGTKSTSRDRLLIAIVAVVVTAILAAAVVLRFWRPWEG